MKDQPKWSVGEGSICKLLSGPTENVDIADKPIHLDVCDADEEAVMDCITDHQETNPTNAPKARKVRKKSANSVQMSPNWTNRRLR